MDAMLLLKATLLLSLTLLAARLLARAPAVARHRLWTLGFAGVLALPLLAAALPALHVPTPARWRVEPAPADPGVRLEVEQGDRSPTAQTTSAGNAVTHTRIVTGKPETSSASTTPVLLLGAWLGGALIATTTLLVSLVRARRLARKAEDVVDRNWLRSAASLSTRLSLRHPPRLLVSSCVGTPMAGGVWRPVIYLPASVRAWSAEQRDVVLAHEIAHLAGRDPLRHVIARLAVACYWFHPLAWISARHAMVAREQACDEAVLGLGTRPSVYARVLLDLADSLPNAAPTLGALPMVERSLLETRLMAILNAQPRAEPTRRGLGFSSAVVGLTLAVAAAQPSVSSDSAALAAVPTATHEPVAPFALALSSAPHLVQKQNPPATTLPAPSRDSACWSDLRDGTVFSGSMSTSDVGGGVIWEQVGTRGEDRVIQKRFEDLQVCLVAEEAGDDRNSERPSEWLGRARRVIIEARHGNATERLTIGRGQRISWQVNSAERTFDTQAEQWRDRMLAVLDTTWELSRLRGQVSSLRGQISSIVGERSSLQGEISSLRGQTSSMRGQISSIRGQESSLRGQISSIQGHVSSLRGAISSEQGAISALNASRYGAGDSDRARIGTRISEHNAEIARIEKSIRDYGAEARIAAVERDISALGTDGKVAAIESEIRAFDVDGKVAAVERRIAALDVDAKVAAIERQIEALDADSRGRQLEERRKQELSKLEGAIAAIR